MKQVVAAQEKNRLASYQETNEESAYKRHANQRPQSSQAQNQSGVMEEHHMFAQQENHQVNLSKQLNSTFSKGTILADEGQLYDIKH